MHCESCFLLPNPQPLLAMCSIGQRITAPSLDTTPTQCSASSSKPGRQSRRSA